MTLKTLIGVKMAVAVVVGMAISIAASHAQTLILSGDSLVTALPSQELTGAFPADDIGVSNGFISSWVVNNPAQDPSGDIFIYQVVNNGPDSLVNIEVNGFNSGEILYEEVYSAESGLTLPGSGTPSSDGSFTPTDNVTPGGAVNFEDGLLSNSSGANDSYFLVIDTDVQLVGTSYGQVQDDFTAAGPTLAPVPEPSSTLMLLAGLASLCIFFKYRQVAGTNLKY